jgi:hypothetical protein
MEQGFHLCKREPTANEVDLQERKMVKTHLQSLYESLGQVLCMPVARDAIVVEIESIQTILEHQFSRRIEAMYPPNEITRLVKLVIEKQLKALEKIRSRELTRYQTLLQSGVSFAERRKVLGDRIALFDK